MDGYKYVLQNNIIHIVIGSEDYQVPVPLNALHDSVEAYSERMELKCSIEIFSAYYKDFDD